MHVLTGSSSDVRLSGGHLSDGDAIRTAGHVVQSYAVEEVDGHRVATMLAMHSDLGIALHQ